MLLNSLKVISIAVGIVAQVPNVNPDDWNELAMDLCMDSVLAKFRPNMGNFFLVTIFLILKKPSCLKNCPLSENAIFRLLS